MQQASGKEWSSSLQQGERDGRLPVSETNEAETAIKAIGPYPNWVEKQKVALSQSFHQFQQPHSFLLTEVGHSAHPNVLPYTYLDIAVY